MSGNPWPCGARRVSGDFEKRVLAEGRRHCGELGVELVERHELAVTPVLLALLEQRLSLGDLRLEGVDVLLAAHVLAPVLEAATGRHLGLLLTAAQARGLAGHLVSPENKRDHSLISLLYTLLYKKSSSTFISKNCLQNRGFRPHPPWAGLLP